LGHDTISVGDSLSLNFLGSPTDQNGLIITGNNDLLRFASASLYDSYTILGTGNGIDTIVIAGSAPFEIQNGMTLAAANGNNVFAVSPAQLTGMTTLSGTSVTETGSLQTFTVPTTGIYSFTLTGAQGGTGWVWAYSDGTPGGLGAEAMGTVHLNAGDVIDLVIGGMGGSSNEYQGLGGGGGGGSFIYNATTSSLIAVAGGGGGGDGHQKGAGQSGTNGGNGGGVGGASGGTNGNGGNGSNGNQAAGGGGFLTNGYGSAGGKSFLNGSAGGTNSGYISGGYGGGGGGYYQGGGGGGGYSGGGGGSGYTPRGGGGGGSYEAPAVSSDYIIAGQNSGNGFTNIQQVHQGARDIIVGGIGIGNNTLSVTAAAILSDSDFANVVNFTTLSLTGSSSVSLASAAQTAGFNQVIGGSGSNRINASGVTSPITLNNSAETSGNYGYLYAGSGADTLIAGSGNDYFYGGSGADYFVGGSGFNQIQGWSGLSTQNSGSDTFMGGSSSGFFVLGDSLGNAYGSTTPGSGSVALIENFTSSDWLQLHDYANDGIAGAKGYYQDYSLVSGSWGSGPTAYNQQLYSVINGASTLVADINYVGSNHNPQNDILYNTNYVHA
jgi:hypothetical protein